MPWNCRMNLDLFSVPPTNRVVPAVAPSATLPDSTWCEPVLTDALSNRKVDVKSMRADALLLAQVHEAIGIVAVAKGEAYRLAQAGKPVDRTPEQAVRITAAI